MKARYSNISDSTFDPLFKCQSSPNTDWGDQDTTVSPKASFGAWVDTLWGLVAHFVLSTGITAFILIYVDGRHFNLTQRSPPVNTAEGMHKAPFGLLQSDIVTIISSIIVVLKCALVAWATPLIWRVAIFLMERRGLDRRDLNILLQYGVLSPGAHWRDFSTFIISLLLIACLAANLSSPMLTGSISWVPSNQLARNLPVGPVQFEAIGDGIRKTLPSDYRDYSYMRKMYVSEGVGRVGIAWGQDNDKGLFKRFSRSVEALPINSTVENATLPYFEVHSIRWAERIDDIPDVRDNGIEAVLARFAESSPSTIDYLPFGFAVLVPNTTTNWTSDPLEATIVRDTQLLVLYYGHGSAENFKTVTQSLPPNVAYTLTRNSSHFAFAWVTFSAGVGRCKQYQCLVSTPSTIQNNTPIALEPHPLAFQAISLSSAVEIYLVAHNTSLPSPWIDINGYVEAILVRSYSGAWTSLISRMATSYANTSYVPSFPGLLADVNHWRVYPWVAIQLLVTLLGILFVIIQLTLSQHPLVGDTTLAAFYLDATEIPPSGSANELNSDGVLKVEPQGDRLKVKFQ